MLGYSTPSCGLVIYEFRREMRRFFAHYHIHNSWICMVAYHMSADSSSNSCLVVFYYQRQIGQPV